MTTVHIIYLCITVHIHYLFIIHLFITVHIKLIIFFLLEIGLEIKEIDFFFVFHAISVISWGPVLVVKEGGKNHEEATGKLYHMWL